MCCGSVIFSFKWYGEYACFLARSSNSYTSLDVLWTRLEHHQEELLLPQEAKTWLQGHHLLLWQDERYQRLFVLFLCWSWWNSPKCIGLCQKRAIGVNCEGKKIILAVKSTKNDAKPCKMVHEAHVKSAKAVSKEVRFEGVTYKIGC